MTEIAEVLEDRPVCRTERVESCLTDSASSCRLIKVNRCHIERVAVRKGRPVTKCERIPRKLCAQVRNKLGVVLSSQTITLSRCRVRR